MGFLNAGGQALPAFGQLATGGAQVAGDTLTQGFNFFKQLLGAHDLQGAGQRANEVFRGATTPGMSPEEIEVRRGESPLYQLEQGKKDFAATQDKSLSSITDAKAGIAGGKAEALGQYDQKAFSGRLSKMEQQAEANRQATTKAIDTARQESKSNLLGLQNQIKSNMSAVRTNIAERTGAMVGGMRKASNQNIATTVQALRAAGASDVDIAAQVAEMKEGTDTEIAGAWSKAVTDVGDMLNKTGIEGVNTTAGLMSTINGMNASLAQTEAAAGESQNAANKSVLDIQAGREAELSGLVWKASEATAALDSQMATLRFQGGQEIAAYDQAIAQGKQAALDYWFQSFATGLAWWAN